MAEENESSVTAPEAQQTAPTRRARINRAETTESRAGGSLMKRAADVARTAPRKAAKRAAKPARTLATLAIVGGLVVTVGLPAYALTRADDQAITLQDAAEAGAQSLVVASEADAPTIERESYSATTPEEIEKKKAEEAAAERARQRAASAASAGPSVSNINLNVVAPGSGAVRWPLGGFTLGDGFMSRGGAHHGVDMLTGGGNPIFAIADGVVRTSQESLGGYGVAIVIDHVINGQQVTSLYGHMIYGSRQVVSGQHVSAGQLIGLVGSTGRSTANHLHLEVRIGGGLVDPMGFLHSNAG